MDFNEIAEKANKIEDEIGLNIDDVLNKLTQELGEFNDAVQKFRGRYCRKKSDNLDDVKGELGDLIFNIISVCKRIGINPNEINLLSENNLKKFGERIELYKNSLTKHMKITICGSMTFYEKMLEIKSQLETKDLEVIIPVEWERDSFGNVIANGKKINDNQLLSDMKKNEINRHFKEIESSDAILVLNYDKNNVPNYVGSNTLMEMGVALWLDKKIFLLNPIPEIGAKEEILAMKPIILNGNLEMIR